MSCRIEINLYIIDRLLTQGRTYETESASYQHWCSGGGSAGKLIFHGGSHLGLQLYMKCRHRPIFCSLFVIFLNYFTIVSISDKTTIISIYYSNISVYYSNISVACKIFLHATILKQSAKHA